MYRYKERGRSIWLRKVLAGCALIVTLTFFGSANATVVESSGNVAIGITDLEIDGRLYDVKFSPWAAYDDVFATRTPTFLNNEAGARAALIAVHAVLNLHNAANDPDLVEVGVGLGADDRADNNWLVPYALNGDDVTSATGNYGFSGVAEPPQWASWSTAPGYANT